MKIGKEIWDDPKAKDEYVDSMLWSQEIFREKFYDLPYDELPDFIRTGMETRPRKGVVIKTLKIQSKFWARDDYYDVVPEFQVTGFEAGDEVRVTVEKITVGSKQ